MITVTIKLSIIVIQNCYKNLINKVYFLFILNQNTKLNLIKNCFEN